MYKLQPTPEKFKLHIGLRLVEVQAVATLKDEYGGISNIYTDDHCYLLANGNEYNGFKPTYYWFREAVEAMKTLPPPQ